MYPSDFHSFNVGIACECGVNAAIIFEHIKFLINKNRADEFQDAFVDGKWWAYGSVEGFARLYPYMGKSSKPVRAAIDTLIESGLIEREEHNTCHWDHTSWYCLTQRGMEVCGYVQPTQQEQPKKPKQPKKPSHQEEIKEVLAYLNEKAGTNFRPSAKGHATLIRARLNEGYGVDDFKRVIDNKVREWSNTEMRDYLRPSTLFSQKHFDEYLNQGTRGNGNGRESKYADYD